MARLPRNFLLGTQEQGYFGLVLESLTKIHGCIAILLFIMQIENRYLIDILYII